jgi:transcriptional regulator with XRE-family HTH domain
VRRKTSATSESDLLASLGKVIRERRESVNITQERLAELTDFDRTYISLVERGKRNLSILNLQVIAAALHQKVSDLLKEAERATQSRR